MANQRIPSRIPHRQASTLSKQAWWVARESAEHDASLDAGPYPDREEAEESANSQGWGFVARETVLTDEATGGADLSKSEIYRVGGALVSEHFFETDLSAPAQAVQGKLMPVDDLWASRSTASKPDSLEAWKARQLQLTPDAPAPGFVN